MLTILRHRTLTVDVTYYSVYVAEGHEDNEVIDLTGWTVRSQIREKRPARRGRDATVVANLNAVIPVPSNGQIRVLHTREFTSSLVNRPSSEIEWDIVATDPTGIDWDIIPTEPVEIITPATNPEDDTSNDFIPGGGGAVHHTHLIAHIAGLQAIIDDFESRISTLEP